MNTSTQRTISDRAGAICRQIFSLTRDGAEWDPADLDWIETMQAHVDVCRDRAIWACREAGFTDGQIAAALGTTRQAVSKRWPGSGRYVGAAGRFRQNRPDGDDAA